MHRKPKYLPRFHDPSVLHELDRRRLHQLLRPHAGFLAAHGVVLPSDPADMDLEAIGRVILEPHDDTPFDLVDALTHIHEMATPEGMDRLQRAAAAVGIALDPTVDRTPADLALQLWSDAPDLLRRQHAEHIVLKRRALDSYLPLPETPRVRPSDLDGALRQFEDTVRAWYRAQGRGDGAAVLVFREERQLRLVIRHGGPYQRKGCLQEGGPGTVQFRPMEFGVAILDRRTWELRINGGGKRERELYRKAVGSHLFGRADFFPAGMGRYTLDPIREGRRCLVCADIPGLRQVRLTELRMYRGGMCRHARIEQADDVFLALEFAREEIPRDALLTAAKFEIVFADSPKPRSVTIRHGNVAQYTRDEDADLVETFLRRRGFVKGGAHAALACA